MLNNYRLFKIGAVRFAIADGGLSNPEGGYQPRRLLHRINFVHLGFGRQAEFD